jgi:Cu2+-exporting ATPase
MIELGCVTARDLAATARRLETTGHSLVYVGWDGVVHAVLALDDAPLPEAHSTVAALRVGGLRVALLTGDHAAAARRIANAIGLEDWKADLGPEAKQGMLDRCRRHHGGVAMVGDGLNDGPVLAAADIGIAVGNATDLARETADLVLPEGGLWMLPWIIALARAVHRTILTNLAWAFGYNLIGLALAVNGYLQPVLAALVMAGSSVLVILNSLRLERLPDPDRRAPGTLRVRSAADRAATAISAAIARLLPLQSDRALPDA